MNITVVIANQLMLDCVSSSLSAANISIESKSTSWADSGLCDGAAPDVAIIDADLCDDIPLIFKLNTMKAIGVPTIVISASAEPHLVHAALDGGAHSYITATDGLEALLEAIDRAGCNEAFTSASSAAALELLTESRTPKLSHQERLCMTLVASGLPMKAVALRLGVTESTAKGYLKNLRAKYRNAGFDIGCKTSLRLQATRDGIYAEGLGATLGYRP